MKGVRHIVLLTVAEASERMRVSKSTVYREIDAGELRAHRIGSGKGIVRVPEDAISEYLDARVIGVNNDNDPEQATLTPAGV